MEEQPLVEAENLKKTYGNFIVFEDISFSIARGELVALIGPNGSGKTTLARMLIGLERVEEGNVTIEGKAPSQKRDLLGYIPQRFNFDRAIPITVEEFLQLVHCNRCETSQELDEDQILNEVGVADLLSQKLGTLSGGQLQRVLIARALMHNRPLIVLDEPSTSIDVSGEAELYTIIKRINEMHGTTFIVISHELDFVFKYATQVLCLNKRLMCSGIPSEVLTGESIKQLFGEHMQHYHHGH